LETQATAAQSGSKEVHGKVRTFAERNVATCFEFADKFVHAKNVQEVMQLQAELVKTQLQAISEQNYAPESKLVSSNARAGTVCWLEREKQAWSILMAVSSGTS
jgi:hypothetical protein